MFAGIVTDDEVILKLVLGPARDERMGLGGRPWVYRGRDKAMTMQEWIVVPDAFYDDQELFSTWAARAHRLVPAKGSAKKGRAPSHPLQRRPSHAADLAGYRPLKAGLRVTHSRRRLRRRRRRIGSPR